MDFKSHLAEALSEAEKKLKTQLKQAERFELGSLPVSLLVSIQISRAQITTYKRAIAAYRKAGGK